MNAYPETPRWRRAVIEQTIDAAVDDVFPLACPVMEYLWIPGWKCELVHCPNGRVELGCVFREIYSAPVLMRRVTGKTVWTTVLHEPERHRVHYRLENEIADCLCKIECEALADQKTQVCLDFTYTPLHEKGVWNMKKGGEDRLKLMLSLLAHMLKYYCERGEMVGAADVISFVGRARELSVVDRLRFLLNGLAMAVMKDDDRKRFQKGLPIVKIRP
ncbi:MAG: SRPBCC family protein [Chloroflexota bacterium]